MQAGELMTTTRTAVKPGLAEEKEKEKTGIRRALGRGLESLLPGPRVVRPGVAAAAPASNVNAGGDAGTRAGAPAPHSAAPHIPAQPGQSGAAAGEHQAAHSAGDDTDFNAMGTIQAVVEAGAA